MITSASSVIPRMVPIEPFASHERCILAFVPNWFALRHEDVSAMRRDVMHLRTRLVVISEHAIWWCSPDEDIECFVTAGPRHEFIGKAARARFQVEATQSGILLLDPRGDVVFRHVGHAPLQDTLIDALHTCASLVHIGPTGSSAVDPVVTQLADLFSVACEAA